MIANARPSKVDFELKVIVEYERMFPTIDPPTAADVPTDHQTFDDRAPLIRRTDDRWPVNRVVTTWKIHWDPGLDRPLSVRVLPCLIANVPPSEQYTPAESVRPERSDDGKSELQVATDILL